MPVSITSNSGNGTIARTGVFSYSYSEDVTGLHPSDTDGGTSQLNFSAIAVEEDKVGTTHPNSALLINNTMEITDTDRGSVQFQVKKASITNGVVSVVGDTIMARLNVERTAPPVGGTPEAPKYLYDAIITYCDLVDITPVFDGDTQAYAELVPVNYIGWTGNVWEYLKMLCSVASISMLDTQHLEMYISGGTLHFRTTLDRVENLMSPASDFSYSVDTFDAAKTVDIAYYDTSYGVNEVIYEESNYAEDADPALTFLASINDSMQVEAGETLIKRFKIAASLETVNQPKCVESITRIPPAPYEGGTGKLGEYVVVGNDDLPIQATQWDALGGKLTVALTENPNEIEVIITAPPSYQMPTAANPTTEVTSAPYKIGLELNEYPAFWLTGTGVFFKKKTKTFLTGAPDSLTAKDAAASIDNPFVTNLHELSIAGVAAAQQACGPNVGFSQTIHGNYQFGDTIGTLQRTNSNSFRVESASYSVSDVQLSGSAYTTIQAFDDKWVDLTFTDFNTEMLTNAQALKFNEFTVIPLTGA